MNTGLDPNLHSLPKARGASTPQNDRKKLWPETEEIPRAEETVAMKKVGCQKVDEV